MTEYFLPAHVWPGKLVYVPVRNHDSPMYVPAEIRCLVFESGTGRQYVEVVVADQTSFFLPLSEIREKLLGGRHQIRKTESRLLMLFESALTLRQNNAAWAERSDEEPTREKKEIT